MTHADPATSIPAGADPAFVNADIAPVPPTARTWSTYNIAALWIGMSVCVPTYMLAYMTRDRTKGPRMPLELVVHKMTRDTALVYGLRDRGLVAPGYKADLNLIDYDALGLEDPEMVYDLPSGGKRLIQRSHGYRATVCSGEVTYEDGEFTGALPGRLLRARFLGDLMLLEVAVEGFERPLLTLVREGEQPQEGEEVAISVDAQSVLVFPAEVTPPDDGELIPGTQERP